MLSSFAGSANLLATLQSQEPYVLYSTNLIKEFMARKRAKSWAMNAYFKGIGNDPGRGTGCLEIKLKLINTGRRFDSDINLLLSIAFTLGITLGKHLENR